MEYHPDKNPDDPTAEEKFKDIGAAYEVSTSVFCRVLLPGNPNPKVSPDQIKTSSGLGHVFKNIFWSGWG